jgi:hypothetical protein
VLLSLIAQVSAAEYRVEATNDIYSAIQLVEAGDVIVFAESYVPDSTSGIWIDGVDKLTLRGEGEGSQAPPLRVTDAESVVLENLIIQGSTSGFTAGSAGFTYVWTDHSLAFEDAQVIVRDCAVRETSSSAHVWARDSVVTLEGVQLSGLSPGVDSPTNYVVNVEVTSGATASVELQDVTISDCPQMGGAKVTSEGGRADLSLTGGRYEGLYAPQGSLVNWDVSSGAGTLVLTGTTAASNGSEDGEIYGHGGEIRLDNFTSQQSTSGSLLALEGGSLEIYASSLLGGSRDDGGGAMRLTNSNASVQRSMICGATSQFQGDIWTVDSELSLQNTTLQAGTGPTTIKMVRGTLKLENVSMIHNSQLALAVEEAELLSIVNTLFQGSDLGIQVDEGSHLDRIAYSMFWDNGKDASRAELLEGDGIELGVEPTYVEGTDPWACDPPLPRSDSGVIDRGDPALEDPWGGRSDVGTYGGPGSEDIGLEPSPLDSGDSGSPDTGAPEVDLRIWHSGGNCRVGAGGGLVGLMGLLLLRRRER